MLSIKDVVIIALALALLGTLHAAPTEDEVTRVEARLAKTEAKAARYAALITACLNGGTLAQGELMVFCDRHVVRVR